MFIESTICPRRSESPDSKERHAIDIESKFSFLVKKVLRVFWVHISINIIKFSVLAFNKGDLRLNFFKVPFGSIAPRVYGFITAENVVSELQMIGITDKDKRKIALLKCSKKQSLWSEGTEMNFASGLSFVLILMSP